MLLLSKLGKKLYIINKLETRLVYLQTTLKLQGTMPTLSDPEVKSYLEDMHRRFVIVPIDKAANNFVFIYKKFYVSRILAGLNGGSNTYKLSSLGQEELINNNIKLVKNLT